jgi:hypothetical protein
MFLNVRKAIFGIVAMTSSVLPFAGAQTITGSVSGTVTDVSGAVVPGAKVVAKNTATNVETTDVTNGSGQYTIRFLQIGPYTVSISHEGFKSFNSAPFTLEVNQTAKIEARLENGSANQVITVQNELEPILDTENPTLGTTFTANTIENLPLNGRNFSSITMFLPGAVTTEPTSMTNTNAIERDTNQGGQVSVNGNRNQTNNYLLDGVEINETINNVIGYNPSPDAIGNLTVITSNAGAEYGNVNGGDVVAVLKSGSNQFHGSAFAFLENHNLDANTWANKFSGVARQPFTQTIFGGTFGGPIKKDRLFYFVDYQSTRYHQGGTQAASVIPASFLRGDFSSLPVQLTHYVPGQGQVPYPNNQVPVTNPVATYLANHPELYPAPNRTPTDGIAQNNYVGTYRHTVRNDQGDAKIDYTPNAQNSFMVRYSQGEASDATPQTPIAITFPTTNSYPFKGVAVNWIHTFSPRLINEARGGWSRVRWEQGVPVDTTGQFANGNTTVGINSAQTYPGFALQDFGNGQGRSNQTYLTAIGTFAGGSSLIDNTFTYGDNVTLQLNKHVIKAGVEVLRYQQNNFYPGNDGVMGRIQYAGAFTGSTISDFVSNNVYYAGISEKIGRSGQRQYRDAVFMQDDWKLRPNLTLNLGIRYEYDQPIYEVNNKQGNVDLATGVYYVAGQTGSGAAFGDSRALYHPTYTNFMPRLGFAYQPKDRIVVRGGYGITNYLEGTGANLRLNFNPPFQPSYTYQAVSASATSGGTPLTVQTAFPASVSGSLASNTYRAWDKRLKPAFIQELSLSIEYQLDSKTSVVASYVGQTGQHLVDARAGNQLRAPNTTAPYAALVGQTGSVVVTEAESMMNYNAGQFQVRRRQSKGLEFQVNYTYAKALTNNPGFFGTASVSGASAYWQNGYNGHADYGPSGFDTRHNISGTAVYELPFGRGRQYGARMNRLLDEAVGGWKITGTAIAFTGLPVTINGPNTANVNSRASRADVYRKLTVRNRSLNNWFGTDASAVPCLADSTGAIRDNGSCAYATSQQNAFGTAAVGTERAPGYQQYDFTAGKSFAITERQRLEFRADFFNALNIASYKNPDNGITDSNFGQISDVRSPPRQIQFSLHYAF